MIKATFDINKLEYMSQIMKAIAHPLRIGIIDLLLQSNELKVKEIHTLLNIQQPEASKQLKVLKNAGLVNVNKIGTTRIYSIVDSDIGNLLSCLESCGLK